MYGARLATPGFILARRLRSCRDCVIIISLLLDGLQRRISRRRPPKGPQLNPTASASPAANRINRRQIVCVTPTPREGEKETRKWTEISE